MLKNNRANKPRCTSGYGNYNASIKNNYFLVQAIFFHLLSKLPPPYDTNLLPSAIWNRKISRLDVDSNGRVALH